MERQDKATFLKVLRELYDLDNKTLEEISDLPAFRSVEFEFCQSYAAPSDLRRILRKVIEHEHLKRYKMEEKDCILRIPLTYDELKGLKTRVDDVFDVAPYVKKLIDKDE